MASPKHSLAKTGFLAKIPIGLIFLLIGTVTFASISLIVDILVAISGEISSDKLGVFGDFFGGILNPIVSIVGFIAVLYTLNSQRADAEEQKQATALANKTQIKQQFEGTFFTLLKKLEDHQHYLSQTYDYAFDEAETFFIQDTAFSELDDYQPTSNEEVIDFLYAKLMFKELTFHTYLKIVKKILILINELNYPYLNYEVVKDKNFYIELLLLSIPEPLILISALEPFYQTEPQNKLIINDPILLRMIENTGFLRTLTFSPLDTKPILGDATWSNANNPVTKALHAYYNLSAFKPIEAPHTNS
ncbi:MAG: hypothetical protein WBP46_02595 [Thiolinea sp.]